MLALAALDGPWLETLQAHARHRSPRPPAHVRCERDAAHLRLAAAGCAPSCDRRVLDRGQAPARLAARAGAHRAWFHPLARITERQAGLVGEQADEAVVRLGTQPSLYARHLVEIEEALRGSPAVFASAMPMVERNQLE